VAAFQTPDDSKLEKALRNKPLRPYSDFLLHDMGNNGDFIEQGGAKLTELRTPSLWGLRKRDPLWHDGRVAGGSFKFRVVQAIAQHNDSQSEGKASAQAFNALTTAQKDQVVAFLNSLGRREFDMNGDGLVDAVDEAAVLACVTGPGSFFNADAPCAVADPDQDGDVDQDDLDLLNVALGVVVPPIDDEDEDEDPDDEKGKGKANPDDFETHSGSGDSMNLVGDPIDPLPPAAAMGEDTAPEPEPARPAIKRPASQPGRKAATAR
jgi:hypothetical protein